MARIFAVDEPRSRRVWVVMPALDEEEALPLVLADLPRDPSLRVVLCDNGSTDRTAEIAREAGALVVLEEQRGYGAACLRALEEIAALNAAADDIVVFLDADHSDDPRELPRLIQPLLDDELDLVIGSRVLGERERGALLPQARFGNLLATWLIWWWTGVEFTDLGPFRALRWGRLQSLRMEDRAYGWTVEMQLKAASAKWRCGEVPVSYRARRGRSKITGTLQGTVNASVTIVSILLRFGLPGRGGLWRGPAED